MRIAFFGGTFDPIHRGHLAIAAAAAETYALDRVLFAPVGHQPLKWDAPAASFDHRLAMVMLACQSDPRFVASALDAPQPANAPNYTVESLRALTHDDPGASLFLLTGADSLLDLRRWRAPDEILSLAEWIVVSRPGSLLLESEIAQLALTPRQRARIHMLSTVHEDVSATELRRRLLVGDRCPGLIPPAVADYIHAHELYC